MLNSYPCLFRPFFLCHYFKMEINFQVLHTVTQAVIVATASGLATGQTVRIPTGHSALSKENPQTLSLLVTNE